MSLFIAQMSETEVCGDGLETSWFCLLVLRTTGNDLLARAANMVSMILIIIAILLGAYVLSRLTRRVVSRSATRMEQKIDDRLERSQQVGAISDTALYRTRRLQRLKAITGVLRGVVSVAIWFSAILLVIGVAGIRLQPIMAGAGLIGVVIGFGAQHMVRDVLAGIAMLVEDQYGVGDWIEIEGVYGEVERVGLRSTAMRDIDGTVHHVLNGSVQRVGNLSQEWARARFDVPIALDTDIPAAKALIHAVASGLADDPVWGQDIIGPPEIWGVQDLGPQGVAVRVVIPTKPLRNWEVTRQLRERLKLALEQANIRMPSQLIEIGGQSTGYVVLTRDVPAGEDVGFHRRRRGDQARATAGAPDGRSDREDQEHTPEDDAPVDEGDGSRDDNPTGDLTTELRLDQGPRPRPD